MATLSPSCVIHEGTVFVALKCYFDGSKAEGQSLTLELVRTIAPVAMKQTPPVQVADMVAWSRNRVEKQTNDKFFAIASLIIHSADNYSFDRAKLETYPPFAIM